MHDYIVLQQMLLEEAEKLFGGKTEYIYAGLSYHNSSPCVSLMQDKNEHGKSAYGIMLFGKGAVDRTDGILQLSHEVIHLLSPQEWTDETKMTNLEEGLAVHFSETVLNREANGKEYFARALKRAEVDNQRYIQAYEMYIKLHQIDKDAVKKLRAISPYISLIKPEHFDIAGINANSCLIIKLLNGFLDE